MEEFVACFSEVCDPRQGNCSPGVRLTLRRPPVKHPAIPSAALQISFDTVTGYSILTTG